MKRSLAGGFLVASCNMGCGGSVNQSQQVEPAEGGAPAMAAAPGAGAPGMGAEPNGTEPVDDMRGTNSYPAVPAGSSSFFWRWGLGNWFVYASDGSRGDARIEQVDGSKACHVTGDGGGVSVNLWAQLDHPGNRPIDLSAYAGIAFDARLQGASALLVGFDANGGFPGNSGVIPLQPFAPSEAWQTFTLRFADVGYEGDAATSIDFIVDGPTAPFELWVRDLALLCRGTCP